MTSTPNYNFPYPAQTDFGNVPLDLQALAEALDAELKRIEDKVDAFDTGIPTPVDGKWLKGSNGGMVWEAITAGDVNELASALVQRVVAVSADTPEATEKLAREIENTLGGRTA